MTNTFRTCQQPVARPSCSVFASTWSSFGCNRLKISRNIQSKFHRCRHCLLKTSLQHWWRFVTSTCSFSPATACENLQDRHDSHDRKQIVVVGLCLHWGNMQSIKYQCMFMVNGNFYIECPEKSQKSEVMSSWVMSWLMSRIKNLNQEFQ